MKICLFFFLLIFVIKKTSSYSWVGRPQSWYLQTSYWKKKKKLANANRVCISFLLFLFCFVFFPVYIKYHSYSVWLYRNILWPAARAEERLDFGDSPCGSRVALWLGLYTVYLNKVGIQCKKIQTSDTVPSVHTQMSFSFLPLEFGSVKSAVDLHFQTFRLARQIISQVLFSRFHRKNLILRFRDAEY